MTDSARLSAYLARLAQAGPVPLTAQGLARIQSAHRQRIAFENLSIPLGEGIACDSDSAFAKLVEARRGGFCFEHNQLLADMLGALGFDVRLLLARVLLGNPPATTPRTHCLVLVALDGAQWIADAGFGGAYAPPMRLTDGQVATSGDGAQHRLRRIGEEGSLPGSWLLERKGPTGSTDGRARGESAWEAQFAFDLAEVAQADMALGGHWAATHPASRFTQATIVSRCLPDGFASMVDRQLSIWRAQGERSSRTITDPADYRDVLAEHFGLDLTGEAIAQLGLWD